MQPPAPAPQDACPGTSHHPSGGVGRAEPAGKGSRPCRGWPAQAPALGPKGLWTTPVVAFLLLSDPTGEWDLLPTQGPACVQVCGQSRSSVVGSRWSPSGWSRTPAGLRPPQRGPGCSLLVPYGSLWTLGSLSRPRSTGDPRLSGAQEGFLPGIQSPRRSVFQTFCRERVGSQVFPQNGCLGLRVLTFRSPCASPSSTPRHQILGYSRWRAVRLQARLPPQEERLILWSSHVLALCEHQQCRALGLSRLLSASSPRLLCIWS